MKKNPTVFMGIGITVLFVLLSLSQMEFMNTMQLKFYDIMMKLRSDPEPSDEIVIVDIDDSSIQKLGRWPWPRDLLAEGIEKITSGKPKIIGLNIILSEPQKSDGLNELIKLNNLYISKIMDKTNVNNSLFLQAMDSAKQRLDKDKILAEAIKNSGKIVLPVNFKLSKTGISQDSSEINETLINFSVQNIRIEHAGQEPLKAAEVTFPIPAFFDHARGIGHINIFLDHDGTVRRDLPLIEYQEIYIPSYVLKLASLYLNVPSEKIRADMGSAIYLGSMQIPLTMNNAMLIHFKENSEAFSKYSYFDVINDKIPLKIFKNKLVLVSTSATGIMNPLSTPTSTAMPFGELSANAISGILNNSYIQNPSWNIAAEYLLLLVLGAIITFILPKLKALWAGITFLLLVSLMTGGAAYFFVLKGFWVRIAYPLFLLIIGYIGVITLSFFVTETRKDKVEGESAESNRMLGLSFQSQGMLDMAYDKFRRVPVDDEMKDILYNLALDFERKRQINKAARVYEYIEKHDKKFKDVSEKKKKLMKVSETMVFGDDIFNSKNQDEDLLSTATDTRPTLGRYEIIKQLGKGAMGIVYLGKDPRINRTTAIKTFRFGDDFEPEEVDELKKKFFREAESAGTLSHPNIVTIYDAGDEHDLAYISMEFLEGEDLNMYTKKSHLLPMAKVINFTADIAEALDYAHQKGIVHRDIKPANIMLLKSGEVKITDFGIARITATSQTQTGVVKGTPYYMSPEQFSGKKVDGRSDIFSLGTMLFQLLTGTLPFFGENPAALMHQIMTVPHPNPKDINPKIITPLVNIIDKALEKDRDLRYQRASKMCKHLREVHKKMGEAMARKAASGNVEK